MTFGWVDVTNRLTTPAYAHEVECYSPGMYPYRGQRGMYPNPKSTSPPRKTLAFDGGVWTLGTDNLLDSACGTTTTWDPGPCADLEHIGVIVGLKVDSTLHEVESLRLHYELTADMRSRIFPLSGSWPTHMCILVDGSAFGGDDGLGGMRIVSNVSDAPLIDVPGEQVVEVFVGGDVNYVSFMAGAAPFTECGGYVGVFGMDFNVPSTGFWVNPIKLEAYMRIPTHTGPFWTNHVGTVEL